MNDGKMVACGHARRLLVAVQVSNWATKRVHLREEDLSDACGMATDSSFEGRATFKAILMNVNKNNTPYLFGGRGHWPSRGRYDYRDHWGNNRD